MTHAGYALTVRAPDGTESAPLEGWTKLSLVLRHQRAGSWILGGLPSSARNLLAEGSGLVVRRHGEVLLSGSLDRLRRVRGRKVDTLEVSGPDDLVVLWDRLVHPSPLDGDYSSSAYDVSTGPAETVLKHFVDVNAGPSALSPRQAAGLTVAVDEERGGIVTGRGRNQYLGDFLGELAVAGGDLGLTVVQDDTGSRVFDVYEPADRTATAVFALELGNLAGYEYELVLGDGNFVVVAGAGEETARIFAEGGDSDSQVRWNRRVERFVDQRQTGVIEELTQKLAEELLGRGDQEKAKLDVLDTRGVEFGSDYTLGDRCTVVVDGSRVEQVVREVAVVVENKGETVTPVLASPGASELGSGVARMFERTSRLARRVQNVERV
jgi:hypothetical protein